MARRRSSRRRGRGSTKSPQERFWSDLRLRIKNGQVVPIVSNSVRNDRIFDIDYDYDIGLAEEEEDQEGGEAEVLTVEQELAAEWAFEIGYPLPDKYDLARVAVYNRIISLDNAQAKREYLQFLKTYLLDIAEEDDEVADLVYDLRMDIDNLSFADIAVQLEYPLFEDPRREDPLRLLAQLPPPIYVTTSHHDFLERALEAEKKTPRTHVCFLFGEPMGVEDKYRIAPDIEPSAESPLVYHLHGIEHYPQSLIISEDDYLDFLVRVLDERREVTDPFIPQRLSVALSQSSILLLGYRLHDWDFKVIFRGLIKTKPSQLRKFGLAIQLDPLEQGEITDDRAARNYLQAYFKPEKFMVEWGTTYSFVKQMCQKWDEWRGGQG